VDFFQVFYFLKIEDDFLKKSNELMIFSSYYSPSPQQFSDKSEKKNFWGQKTPKGYTFKNFGPKIFLTLICLKIAGIRHNGMEINCSVHKFLIEVIFYF